MADAFFIQYAAQGDYPDGIFMPFATEQEALNQAAWEIHNGADPDSIDRIFRAPHDVPARAWTRAQVDAQTAGIDLPRHLVESHRVRTLTSKQIRSKAAKVADALVQASVKASADELLGIQASIRDGSAFKMAVPGNAYSWNTGGTATATACALAAATAKTVVLVLSAAANQCALTEVGVSFDGVTASAVPVLVELVSGTAGAAGTPRAALAAGKQIRGWPAQTSQTTCGDTYSGEPTTQLVNRKWLVTPNGGMFIVQFPLGREPTGVVTAATDAKTWSIRCTAPAIVNVHAYIEYEE